MKKKGACFIAFTKYNFYSPEWWQHDLCPWNSVKFWMVVSDSDYGFLWSSHALTLHIQKCIIHTTKEEHLTIVILILQNSVFLKIYSNDFFVAYSHCISKVECVYVSISCVCKLKIILKFFIIPALFLKNQVKT